MLLSSRIAPTALVFTALALVTAACSTRTDVRFPGTPVVAPEVVTVAPAPEPEPVRQADPATELIAVSGLHFEAGRRELELGHLEAAKREFNRALEVLLESPFGGRTEPRVRAHFDQLVERISAYEVTALAQGDGFAEQQQYESATIDEILAISTFEIPLPTAETTQAVTDDLNTIGHDIDIPLNPRVLSFVQLFSGRLKSFLEEGLSRGVQYLPMIQEVFRAEGLPLDLAYVPLVESAFKPSALSRAKARGIWQFMRGTGLENGLAHDWYVDERADAEKATRAAAKYLKTLNRMFKGDWHLALASYNGGPGRVQRAVKRSGRNDFWKLSENSSFLPRETRDYVPLILASIIIARNPAQYGLNVAPIPTPRFETVTLSAAVDLRRIAEWIDMPVKAVQDLNPELRRWTTPVRANDYELKVPEGTADIVRAHLAQSDPDDLAPLNWHVVKKGETLATIARKLKVNRTDLAEANYLSTRAKVNGGQRLIIPRAPALLTARADTPAPATESRQVDVALASNVVAPAAGASTKASLTYRVKRGDTLFSIAKLYRTTVASLKTWNRLRTNALQVGQRLTIFTSRPTTATN
jgi:membrane-bound lytic murein transglycosylase D